GSYRPSRCSSPGSGGRSATAHRRDHRNLVAVVKGRVVALLRLGAGYPDPSPPGHRAGPRAGHPTPGSPQPAPRPGLEGGRGAPRRLTRLGEQPQPDAQIAISATPSLMTASPAGFALSKAYTVLPSRSPALQKRVVIVSPGSTGLENRTANRFSNAGSPAASSPIAAQLV